MTRDPIFIAGAAGIDPIRLIATGTSCPRFVVSLRHDSTDNPVRVPPVGRLRNWELTRSVRPRNPAKSQLLQRLSTFQPAEYWPNQECPAYRKRGVPPPNPHKRGNYQ